MTQGQAITKHVLLVEDDPADIYLVQRAIADCGLDVQLWVLSYGSEALPFLRQELPFPFAPAPVLILLDLRLPDADGHDILLELRRLPTYQTTPVIVLSAAERTLEEPRCLQLGANAYVQKRVNFPIYFRNLKTGVQRWLGKTTEAHSLVPMEG